MNRLLGAILLVAGTTIGAGMLGLPTVTGLAGFFPTLLIFICYWLFMTYTAFLILEVNLWMDGKANMISMARKTLGPIGEMVAWGAYLFLLYALTTAYLAGSGPIVLEFAENLFGWELPAWAGIIPLLVIFGYFVIKGTSSVDMINRYLMIGLGIAFVIMAASLSFHLNWPLLEFSNWRAAPLALSIIATSFGFHIIIPSLVVYLRRDVKRVKLSIIIGSLIPLIVYIVWELLTLGIVPHGVFEEGYLAGKDGATLLTEYISNPGLILITRMFAFFAIMTSFLGVSLSLSDCIADGLHLKKVGAPSWVVDMLTFLPPIMIVLIDPSAFLLTLDLAGAYGVIVLLALMPALMVWKGRYGRGFQGVYEAPGGRLGLISVIAVSIIIITLQVFKP
jgi:tyrosine-specific transport protein